jgi:histidine triad (HIT) family protein
MDKSIFEKIIDREIPSEILFEDSLCIVIKDIAPKAPVHLLIIPKKPISKLSESSDEDTQLLGHLLKIVRNMAKKEGIDEAFNVIINNGEKAGQTVFHLHIHLLGGGNIEIPNDLKTN